MTSLFVSLTIMLSIDINEGVGKKQSKQTKQTKQTTWPNMTSICRTLEFLKFKILKSKKKTTKFHNHIIAKSIPLLLKRKPNRIFNFNLLRQI